MTEHVKIYGIKPRIQYTADGTSASYEFPFAIFSTSDIDVYFGNEKQESTSYTVSEARHSDGGTITFETAPESGTTITIVRNLSIERTSDFQEGSTLRAKVLNDELDYQIACTQQIAENLNRSMVLPPYATDNDLDLTLPVPSAGKAIVWNADGTNLENSAVAVNEMESALRGYKTAAETAASTATTKAEIASDKADIATVKAAEAVSTLADKAGKDMDNLSASGQSTVSKFSKPSDTYENITLSTSGSTYTAPANGYVAFNGQATSSWSELVLNNKGSADTGDFSSSCYPRNNSQYINTFVPVKKDDVVHYFYNDITPVYFRFIYAEGEV